MSFQPTPTAPPEDDNAPLVHVINQALLFSLMAGMSASVDPKLLQGCFQKWQGIAIGLFCQFGVLPFLGFAFAMLCDLDQTYGIALITTCASPGGAYSNWWCSLMNADLALSVAMTACSVMVSVVFMPANLLLWTSLGYSSAPEIQWAKFFRSLAVAVAAILVGSVIAFRKPEWGDIANRFGNISGLLLIVAGAWQTTATDPLWSREPMFYAATTAPCAFGLVLSSVLAFHSAKLSKPEAVAVAVETIYQNTGLAYVTVMSSFGTKDALRSAGVPVFYQVVQLLFLPAFLLSMWKAGCTHAPPSTPFTQMVVGNFQPGAQERRSLRRSTSSNPEAVHPTEVCLATVDGTADAS